jgi:pyruvate dehydrogenase E2 component (dihydrolipoamide acetyltransferase)
MATFEFKLPDLGEGVVEGEIVGWLVKPGDVVKEDQGLVELMTDKATVTVPSPVAGTVLKTYGNVGEMAKVHAPLVDFELAGTAPKQADGHAREEAPGQEPPKTQPATPPVPAAAARAATPAQKVLATPVTRRMAREHHIDLGMISGSGPQGRVLKTDVEAFLASGGARGNAAESSARPVQSWVPLASSAVDQRVPLRGLRKKIAEKMVRSKFTAPHYAFVEEVDVSSLVRLREDINAQLRPRGVKLSFLPFFVKAVTTAFRKFPQVNANMDEATQELIIRGEMNIGIATMTDQGLTVPVIKQADRRGLLNLAEEINRLATAARDQKLKLEELSGGTFTITSLGQTGGLFATPIINHPEVAIMGVHRMRKRPLVLENDQIAVRPVMNFSFCFDHRVIDGATGADFAYEVLKYVEHPELFMLDLI